MDGGGEIRRRSVAVTGGGIWRCLEIRDAGDVRRAFSSGKGIRRSSMHRGVVFELVCGVDAGSLELDLDQVGMDYNLGSLFDDIDSDLEDVGSGLADVPLDRWALLDLVDLPSSRPLGDGKVYERVKEVL
ncbi:hypothetical protein Droror1_Dr00002219 [Drosera rotundifolia]